MSASAGAPAVHTHLRCRFCSRWRLQQDFAIRSIPVISPCIYCLDAHQQTDLINSGQLQPFCYECGGVSLTADERVQLVLHRKDGIQQYLCLGCSDAYERKRLDLFGDTPYGYRKRLKGAK